MQQLVFLAYNKKGSIRMANHKDISAEITNINNKYKLGNVKLVHGKGNKLQHFFWWRITFSPDITKLLKEKFQDYQGIHLMPYYTGQQLFNRVKHTNRTYPLPNLDRISGNMHPNWNKKDTINWNKNASIKQIILVKKHGKNNWGPLKTKLPRCRPHTNYNIKEIADPNCYYPSTESIHIKQETTETLVKKLLLQILDLEKIDPDSALYKNLHD